AAIDTCRLTTAPRDLQCVHSIATADVEQCVVGPDVPQVPVLCLGVGEQMLGMDVFGALAGPARQPDGQTLGLRVGPDDGSEAEPAQAARHHAPNLIVTWIGRT